MRSLWRIISVANATSTEDSAYSVLRLYSPAGESRAFKRRDAWPKAPTSRRGFLGVGEGPPNARYDTWMDVLNHIAAPTLHYWQLRLNFDYLICFMNKYLLLAWRIFKQNHVENYLLALQTRMKSHKNRIFIIPSFSILHCAIYIFIIFWWNCNLFEHFLESYIKMIMVFFF